MALAEVPCLLVSELVTNAIVHTNNSVGLPLCLAGRRLRTSVADESSRLPELRACELDEDRVRGLQLVEALAEEHGVLLYVLLALAALAAGAWALIRRSHRDRAA